MSCGKTGYKQSGVLRRPGPTRTCTSRPTARCSGCRSVPPHVSRRAAQARARSSTLLLQRSGTRCFSALLASPAVGPRPVRRHRPPQRQDRAIRHGARAGACGARWQDRRCRQHRRHPRHGRPEHPRDRSRRPHRHPRPDQFPHPRHPRRAHVHDRGALDRHPHVGGGARPHPRRGGESAEGVVADRRRRLDRAAVCRRPSSHAG